MKYDSEIFPHTAEADHHKRRVAQLLGRAGLKSAGVRQNRDCSYRVPANASGFFCAAVVCSTGEPRFHEWGGVEIHWFGDDLAPFEAMGECLRAHGYELSAPEPISSNSGRPSITAWASR